MKKAILVIMCALLAIAWIKNPFIHDSAVFYERPLQSLITKAQPLAGIVLWTNNPKNKTDAISLEFTYMSYNEIVKNKETYDWSALEKKLDAAASRNHQLIFRFKYVYPGFKTSVPDYIKQLSDYKETVGLSEKKKTWFPDWTHKELHRFTLVFYKKLAEKYDTDERLAYIQVGFGLWGEYHIYDGPCKIGTTFPSKKFQEQFFRNLANVFQKTHWMISIDSHDEKYSSLSKQPYLQKLPFGLFDDSFMHKNHNKYNAWAWKFFGKKRYMVSPAGGEFSYYTNFDQKNVLNKTGLHGVTFEQAAKKYHITYMIGNDQPGYQSINRIKEASLTCGYKFKVLSVKSNVSQTIITVKNIGVAPIYYDAFVSVNGIKSKDSLRDLLPGMSKEYVISSGGENPKVAIICNRILKTQRIEFEAHIKTKSIFRLFSNSE